LQNKIGVEIGGPSSIFKTILPIYHLPKRIDGVNFSRETIWEGQLKEGLNFEWIKGKYGHQFISEATKISKIRSNTYDFLLSSNCLEHIANPLKAIKEWRRIITPSGYMVLILPNQKNNFDHKRPVTKFSHLKKDYELNTTEEDLTHLKEILKLHDLSKDPGNLNFEAFKLRSKNNYKNRCLHHHIFDLELIVKMLKFSRFKIIQTNATAWDWIVLAKKTNV